GQVQRDRVWTDEMQGFWQQYQSLSQRYRVEGREDERLDQWRWLLEEYRVSLFAQQLGTRMPVSDKRLKKHWQEITGRGGRQRSLGCGNRQMDRRPCRGRAARRPVDS